MQTSRDILHFSHANGFPAACYRELFGFLSSRFQIGYVNTIGHDPRYPVTDNWPRLVDELIHAVSTNYRRPVIGVGHSLGGYLTFMAAMQRPELFRAIVLLDAPLLSYFKSRGLEMSKWMGIVDRVTPGASTRNRRREWKDEKEVIAHFRNRQLFRRFDPECLADYAHFGMTRDGDHLRLLFDPEIEYRIYCTIPHHFAEFGGPLEVPAGFVGGRDSEEVRRVGLSMMKRRYGFRFKRVEGTHLFPFEYPEMAAGAIVEMIDRLEQEKCATPAAAT
jgi:pimeloyl-ACP methyl ester carboxylesterase